jgi:hypothetical protein
MTQRSILSGTAPVVVIHVGMDVVVHGVESDRVTVEANGWWGLELEKVQDEIKVQLGISGRVDVPYNSHVTVFAGKSIQIDGVRGDISAVTGLRVTIREGGRLMQASAGGSMDIDCAALGEREMKLEAGRDLRLWIRDLDSAHFFVTDLGGDWEGTIGAGEVLLTLHAGGDVTLVTEHEVTALPPHFILGKIEKPTPRPSQGAGQ